MKLRTKYLIFVGLIHALALVMSYFIFEQHKIWFLLAEVLVCCSVLLSWQLYNQMIRPLNLLVEGAKAISDRDFTVKLVQTGMLEMDQLIMVYNQMIDELRKERTRQQQQHFFLEKLMLNSPVGIVILDHDNRVNQVNPAAKAMLEIMSPEGWLLSDIDHPIINRINGLLAGNQQSVILPGSKSYNIQVSAFVDSGFPRHFVLISELTSELLYAEKMAYGKVIRMMAHEVNNTIGPVNSILQSALVMQQEAGVAASLSNAMQVAIDRNHNLNRFMRNLADVVRLPEPSRQYVNLEQLIGSVITLFADTAAAGGITFSSRFAAQPLSLLADPLQIEQVLINIVKNAMEAIGSSAAGEITFITTVHPAALVIRDNGSGFDAATAALLFTPFFSTKADGQGIGLTLIKDILINHGYQFSLAVNAAGHTEFTIVV